MKPWRHFGGLVLPYRCVCGGNAWWSLRTPSLSHLYVPKMIIAPGNGEEVDFVCLYSSPKPLGPCVSVMQPAWCAVRRGWASALLEEKAPRPTGLAMG